MKIKIEKRQRKRFLLRATSRTLNEGLLSNKTVKEWWNEIFFYEKSHSCVGLLKMSTAVGQRRPEKLDKGRGNRCFDSVSVCLVSNVLRSNNSLIDEYLIRFSFFLPIAERSNLRNEYWIFSSFLTIVIHRKSFILATTQLKKSSKIRRPFANTDSEATSPITSVTSPSDERESIDEIKNPRRS